MDHPSYPPPKGRGAAVNPDNRFAEWAREAVDNGWGNTEEEAASLATCSKCWPRRAIRFL